jgi:transposase
VVHDIASVLFGVEGLQVVEAEAEADGTLTVWAVTGHLGAAVCPDCGTRAGRVHGHVLARPRDLRRGLDEVSVCWLKRRWKCGNDECGRKTFTESLPEVPAGCRLTGRLRQLLGAEVAERGCTPAEAGRGGSTCRGQSPRPRSCSGRARCWPRRRARWRIWDR